MPADPKSLPYSTRDLHYDNGKLRHRSRFKVLAQAWTAGCIRLLCGKFTTWKFLCLLMICGLTYLFVTHKSSIEFRNNFVNGSDSHVEKDGSIGGISQKPPRLPPQITASEIENILNFSVHNSSEWRSRQERVKESFVHAWSGYVSHAMGYDELMPLSQRGTDGLGGLGATVIDALDTAMIMGADDIVSDASLWIEKNLMDRISEKGQVNLFETTIRVLGGLLSAYHLSVTEKFDTIHNGLSATSKRAYAQKLLDISKNLADRLMSAFTSSPSAIPLSDVVLRDHSAHPAPGGLSSTSEVATLQLEFNYLSKVTGDSKYQLVAMKVFEHIRTLPKVEGLVPIYISPHSGQFSGENIRLGSRGDSYYEYLLKVWIQQKNGRDTAFKYLYEMYTEAMRGTRHLLVRKSIPKGLVFVGELPYGQGGAFSPKMDHLVCFLPGTLALGATKGLTKKKALESNMMTAEDLENLKLAEDLAKTCYEIYSVTSTGLAPEIVYFHIEGGSDSGPGGGNTTSEYVNDIIIKPNDRHNLLRPETVESLFVMHRITEDPKYREWGWEIFQAFERHTKVDSGGYASLDDVTRVPPPKRDKMETFFLGETLKYLYLLFGENDVLPLDKVVFNTEAHPIPII